MPRYPALEALSDAIASSSIVPSSTVPSQITPSSFELTRTAVTPTSPLGIENTDLEAIENTDLEAEEIDFDALEDEFTSYFDDDDDTERFMERVYKLAKRTPARRKSVSKLLSVNDDELKNDPDAGKFTNPALNELHERGLITELLYELKSGKEATVYVAQGNEGLIAVKLYVDSRVRSFKNDAIYREGRFIADGRMKKAIDQRSDTGVSAQNYLWVGEEFSQLHALYNAGLRSPKPLAHEGGVILMEFVGDESGAAPRVADARLSPSEAEIAFEQSLEQYAIMLSIGRVHGDYSTFNLLWWEGQCVVIDFPQVIKVKENPSASGILERDIQGLCRTFRTFGIKRDWVAALATIKAKARALQTTMLPEELERIL